MTMIESRPVENRPFVGVSRKISLLRHHHAVYVSDGLQQGQAYFAALRQVDPVLADRIRNTTADPFHHDDRIVFFLTYVYKYWGWS